MSRVSVRYIIDDVPAAMRFYMTLLGFTLEQDASPAFASVVRDGVRLLLSGDGSSGKRPLPDGRRGLGQCKAAGPPKEGRSGAFQSADLSTMLCGVAPCDAALMASGPARMLVYNLHCRGGEPQRGVLRA